MSYSTYMLGLINESDSTEQDDFPSDTSGFSEEPCFGQDKIEKPSEEGMDAATDAMSQFADSSDGQDTDIDLSIEDSFPEDNSGFEKDANSEIENEEEFVDPNTIPANNEENDQFDFGNETIPAANISAEELAKDDDSLEETATGWDDLF